MSRATAIKARAPSDPVRTAELAAIHVAKKNLALTDDSYRGLISRFTKKRTESSADMTATERRELIEYFRDVGFIKIKSKNPKTRRADYRPQAEKLKQLWYALYELGVVRNREQEALEAFVCRHTNIEVMRWNFPVHLSKAIDCLKAWCGRVGWEAKPCKVPGPQQGSFAPGLILAQWERLIALGTPAPTLLMWMRGIGINVASVAMLSDDQAKEVVKALGRFIRARSDGAISDGDGDG
jgi:hypothetical protein